MVKAVGLQTPSFITIIYTAAGIDITTSIDVPDNLQSSKTAVRLVQLLST